MKLLELLEKTGFEKSDIERILYVDSLYPEMKEFSLKAFTTPFKEFEPEFQDIVKEGVGIREVKLLFVAHAFLHLYDKYLEKGYSEEFFFNSAIDLYSKCLECKGIHSGEVGIIPFTWFNNYFTFNRFSFGRLQYDTAKTYPLDEPYEKGGYVLNKGDFVIDCHIPSGKEPLTEEACFDSYKRAYEFFKDRFSDGIMKVVCSTWLFTKAHIHIMGKNTQRFFSDFDIVYETHSDNFDEGWRVFSRIDMSDPDSLPQNTSLQKRFVEYMKSGGKFGSGYGVFFFDGEKILK